MDLFAIAMHKPVASHRHCGSPDVDKTLCTRPVFSCHKFAAASPVAAIAAEPAVPMKKFEAKTGSVPAI